MRQGIFDLITARTVFKGGSNAPRAVLTDTGWTIGGPHDSCYQQSTFHATTFQCIKAFNEGHDDDDLYKLVASFWIMESFGINPEVIMSKNGSHALKTFPDRIRFVYNRYEVGSFWKPNAELPNNFTAALQQYKRSKQRLILSHMIYIPPPSGKIFAVDISTEFPTMKFHQLVAPTRTRSP